jgi:RNA recognition motif-containing protein
MVQARSFSDAVPVDQRKLYVGNLSFKVASEDLENHFAQFGAIEEAFIVMDREVSQNSHAASMCSL